MARKYFKVNEAEEIVSSTLDRIIEERIKEYETNLQTTDETESNKRRDLLSMLVEANVLQNGLLSRSELKADSFIFALAGHETTASSSAYVCYELAKRPEIQKKAREEIDRLIGNRAPTYEDYNQMHYLNAIVMEALRLHPPVVNVFRIAKKTTTIGEFTIPKGSTVMINIFSTNRNEKYWEKPNEFIPERFPMNAEEQSKIQHDFTWVPFSMGNRKCIGYKFAEIEAFSILCRILQFYELELLNNEQDPLDKVTDIPGITVRPGNLKISLKPRSDLKDNVKGDKINH
ncbi:predicted protein [Naegleria gruberi]|uniref:Predicted protein n=1 Tax=Naegleria gruberi TaxID=5762 RepID=D2VJQ3_NAEGR|nr:uncharacterized protein NAEGRDRAFT_69122 [Naegleria gruberi]EFC43070.1 predicted protein [Naegleria gruberi]|eukprot:XP_002675814.1 predicted protein [Naegleria gruberi strain NEG-M]